MNLYDIVEGLRDGTDNPIKLQNRVGVSEDSWFDGQDQWATGAGGGQWSSSDHDNWTKESAGTINPLTGVDEAIGYESNKSYAEVGPYKRYMVYVTKKKFNEKFGFIAVAVNPRTNDAKFKAAGQTQQDAVASLHSEVDKEIDVATKVSGAATIDFNVDFVRDVLEMSSNTFYAKIVPGPKLVIAGKEMEQYPDIMKSEGFKASSIRTVGDSEGATKLPAMPLSATGATTAQLVANGRYALGQETIDRDGNRVFELEFDSVVADPRERIRMGAPAITIGTKRETKEDSSDFMANDSASPVGGNMQFENRLHVGDPVIVTAPNEFEGKTGEISEFSPSGKFVVVNLYNYGEHSMHLSDVEYNEYADRDEDELDEGASVAYVTTYFDTKTGDRGESTVSALTRKEAADKIVQLMHERGYDITVTAVRPAIDEGEVTQTSTGLKHRATKGYGADYEFGKGVELAKQKHHADLNKVDKKLTKSLEKGMDVHFDEGWSDRDREHYAVYVNGKKKIWQDLQGRPLTDNHARNIMYKMREKYRKTGQDPMRITIAPVDYDKDQGVSEGAGQQLSVQQLATISDAALDAAYHYGRSQPGNTFGWQANLKSAAFAKQMIDRGVTDIEAISDAIHKGWNVTAQAFVKNPMQFDDSKTMAPEKLQAKIAQRQQLMTQQYAQLPEEEKEKDRVVARAMLQAITGQQGVSEDIKYKDTVSHPQFGAGYVVKSWPDGMISVDFADYPDPITKEPGVRVNMRPGSANYKKLTKSVAEAGSPAQQAAIAIAMKKADKKPKTESVNYWHKLQAERSKKLNTLVNELKESIK